MKVTKQYDTIVDYRGRINAAVVFIEENAGGELSIESIASHACLSPYHFHRIFTAFTGETPGECCRRMRMRKAATLLAAGHTTDEIALETGYQTSSAFIRVFKSTFGASPSRLKQSIDPARLRYPVIPAKNENQGAMPIAVLKEFPDLSYYYVRAQGRKHENFTQAADGAFDQLFAKVFAWYADPFSLQRLGIIRDQGMISSDECRFDAALVIPEKEPRIPPDELQRGLIPGGLCAVFTHKGAYNTLWQTWSQIYRYWYPASGRALRETAPFEIYHNSPLRTPPQELVTEICIPLNK